MAAKQERGTERPETLVVYATRRIKMDLASGAIAQGARLSPTTLAEMYGLSHIPVREALSSLSATGFVVHKGGRGYFARELSSDDLDDIYQLRQLLESEAYRRGVPRLTDEDVAEMIELVDQMDEKLDEESRQEYLELNRTFHFVAFARCGSRRLIRFLNYLWDSAQPYAVVGTVTSAEGNVEHRKMLDSFAARDAEAVIDLMQHHRDIRRKNVAGWERSQHAED